MSGEVIEPHDGDWECDCCGEMKPEQGGEEVEIGVTRVDHMIVSRDMAWICQDCKEWAEGVEWDRADAIREDKWFERYQYEELK